ncbi:MAG: Planctomycete cytochrome [Verrucomicrobiales bacterium]|nr:Planctomycete cytochrome [Verrucomicrobiales bacterium]
MISRPLLLALTLAVAPWSPVLAGRTKAFTAADRAWWSFQPVRDPALPAVKNEKWPRTPVDRFILERLEKAGLPPAPEAPRETLVRRVYFDLIGLPPTRAEVESFVADTSPDAWEKLVDRLLASPRHGERQARLWLDLVRYAESDGYKSDDYRPDAWRYRDYVIDAFNSDKPYNLFVSEQIAGDEMFPDDPEALVATGYLRHWIYEYNNRDVAGQWNVILNDITDTTADVFMGLGLQCARCHDHKFDPLLQADYYRLQAFFAPLDPRDGTAVLSPSQKAERAAREEKWNAATAGIRQQIADIQEAELRKSEKKAVTTFPPETQAILAKPLAERTPKEKQLANLAWKQVLYEWDHVDSRIKGPDKEKLTSLRKELSAFDALKPAPLPTALTISDIGPQAPEVLIPRREADGDIAPGFPTLLAPGPAAVTPRARTTGRRLALAAWLTDPANPLTARVMVNRVWQQHFGKGLSITTSDFGTLGDAPSHPELLDWLTHRFVREGWSLKKLHRVILTSAAWKQGHASDATARATLTDPENRLLWRWNTRRLEAEQIRDAILQATGELDFQAGGPGVDSNKPRRTIYTKVLRNVRDPLTDVFDAPQNFQSTPSRDTTTTASQSLFLANSKFMAERADAMAARLGKLPDADAQVEAAWWNTAGRLPTTEERSESLAFLESAAPPDSSAADASPGPEPMPQRNGKAAALTPGTGLTSLEADLPGGLPTGTFSMESIALLHSVYEAGEVRPLLGQWSGSPTESGWSFGVTGMKSKRRPWMPVVSLCGTDAGGKVVLERVFSDLTLQADRSYYLGFSYQPATVSAPGLVTFFVKDLANEDLPVLSAAVPHPVVALAPPAGPLFIGASNNNPSLSWDGLVDEVRVTRGILTEDDIFLKRPEITGRTVAAWQFEPDKFTMDAVSGKNTVRLPETLAAAAPARRALTDFSHAMLSSSAMFYVD